jgi:hypothetical protein
MSHLWPGRRAGVQAAYRSRRARVRRVEGFRGVGLLPPPPPPAAAPAPKARGDGVVVAAAEAASSSPSSPSWRAAELGIADSFRFGVAAAAGSGTGEETAAAAAGSTTQPPPAGIGLPRVSPWAEQLGPLRWNLTARTAAAAAAPGGTASTAAGAAAAAAESMRSMVGRGRVRVHRQLQLRSAVARLARSDTVRSAGLSHLRCDRPPRVMAVESWLIHPRGMRCGDILIGVCSWRSD